LSCLFCLTGRGYQYAHANFFSFGLYHLNQLKKEKKKYLCMYIDKQNQLKKKKYYFFLFLPVTLQTLNGSSTVLVAPYQVSPMTFLPVLLNRSRLPICSYNLFLFWPVTLQALNGTSTVLVSTTSLANDFPAFFA